MPDQLLGLIAVQLLLDWVWDDESRLNSEVQVNVGRVLGCVGRVRAATSSAQDLA